MTSDFQDILHAVQTIEQTFDKVKNYIKAVTDYAYSGKELEQGSPFAAFNSNVERLKSLLAAAGGVSNSAVKPPLSASYANSIKNRKLLAHFGAKVHELSPLKDGSIFEADCEESTSADSSPSNVLLQPFFDICQQLRFWSQYTEQRCTKLCTEISPARTKRERRESMFVIT